MPKKVIAFDLDGTLAPSKSYMHDRMGLALTQLLDSFTVCIISGGRFEQFNNQVLNTLSATPAQLERLHLMPTCGTQYFRYDPAKSEWSRVYAELIPEDDKAKIAAALERGFTTLGFKAEKTYGPTLEDRESQITYSVLGQNIVDELGEKGVEIKYAWDPDNSKKQAVRDFVAPLIPDYEVRVGGVTSLDVTRPGIDKAYGMNKLMELLKASKDEVLFIGDRLQEGGNDYPVKAMGIDCLEVVKWEDTALVLEGILHVTH